MHYNNGREAKVGDLIVGKDANGKPIAGIVFQTNQSESCNLNVVPLGTSWFVATARDCLHVDDLAK